MADLSSPFDKLLSAHAVHRLRRKDYRPAVTDEFLKSAYQINDHLRSLHTYLLSIRKAYLSTAPPPRRPRPNRAASPTRTPSVTPQFLSPQDKTSIDASSKEILRDISASLTQLASAESVRRETVQRSLAAKYNKGILGRWAAGGHPDANKSATQRSEESQIETLRTVRENILWYLAQRLEQAGETQHDMMQRRLERDLERGRSVLYKTRDLTGFSDPTHSHRLKEPDSHSAIQDSGNGSVDQLLSAEQLQLFAQENQTILKQYEDTLDQVRTAEKSMLEISELQTQLVQNLDIQSANISQMVSDTVHTEENVGGGNRQLKRATERQSTARLVFYASCGLCGFLVTWDLIF